MKKIHSECNPKFNATIMRFIEDLTTRYAFELRNGFEVIVRIRCTDEEASNTPYYELAVQNDDGFSMSVAEAKMNFMDRISQVYSSGYDRMDDLIEDLWELKVDNLDPQLYADIVKLPSPHCMLPDQHRKLVELTGVSAHYGAIRLTYRTLITEESEDGTQHVRNSKGQIDVSFDGAMEWQNLFLAFSVLRKVQEAMLDQWENDMITFNTDDLEDTGDHTISFCMSAVQLLRCKSE